VSVPRRVFVATWGGEVWLVCPAFVLSSVAFDSFLVREGCSLLTIPV